MSLGPEFFEARERKLLALLAQGHVDLDDFMQANAMDWQELLAAGLVKPKLIQSTGDLVAFEPTVAGHYYLRHYKDVDLLVVRAGRAAVLLSCCRTGLPSAAGR
ncbi:MAG: hypothetical protein IPG92_07385 [Flavobacteriales bacterium]|nr:hypothetical protein [Flavobacteriales bacterium]